MKRIFWLLLLSSLRVADAYGDCSGNSINVRDCGASCACPSPGPTTNCHDDTDNINAALDAVNAAGGGEVIIPPGTCIIAPSDNSRFLHLYSNLTIRGSGRKSTLKIRDGIGNYSNIFAEAPGVGIAQP